MHLLARRAVVFAFGLLCSVGAIALVRDTASHGQDFETFWRAGRAFLAGLPVYDLARDGSRAFPFPPWALPLFIPFSAFSVDEAKWAWGIVQGLSLLSAAWWCVRQGCSRWVVALSLVAFWGIWVTHAFHGETILLMLALSLWGVSLSGPASSALAAWALSLRIFTFLPVIGVHQCFKKPKQIAVTLGAFIVLSLPTLLVAPRHSPTALLNSWGHVVASGINQAPERRGADNLGLPAAFLRVMDVPAENRFADLMAFIGLSLVIGGIWMGVSSQLGDVDRWIGWLGLAAALHPIAPAYLFVLAFPLAAIALDRSVRSGRTLWILLAAAALICLALPWVKSLGVLMALWVLARDGHEIRRMV